MLCLYLNAGSERLAIPASRVLEVVPAVRLHRPAGVPDWVAGVFRYRGAVTPVIDLPRLASGSTGTARLRTRIVLVEYPTPDGPRPLGLLAERVTDLGELNTSGAEYAPVAVGDGPDLGPMVADAEGVVRLPTVERLVPLAHRSALFGAEGGP